MGRMLSLQKRQDQHPLLLMLNSLPRSMVQEEGVLAGLARLLHKRLQLLYRQETSRPRTRARDL